MVDNEKVLDLIRREAAAKTGFLDLSGLDIRSLPHQINSLSHLQTLVIWNTGVRNLAPVQHLKNLSSLDCGDTPVHDLSPLEGLLNLRSINCSGTKVSDLSPIQKLPLLQSLDCYECPITSSLQPILSMTTLREMFIGGIAVPDIPPGILSEEWNDNCLDRLRAHFDDLAKGAIDDTHIKLLILGNGGVGKTQITGRLCNHHFKFNPTWESTHGIRIHQALPLDIGGPKVALSVWDFGGQEIYHGTHALFLNSPAIIALVWDRETEGRPRQSTRDLALRDYPMPYWLTLAQRQSDGRSPIIPIQSKCDREGDKAAPHTLDADTRRSLRHGWHPVSVSAKTGYGWTEFISQLRGTVAWMRDPDKMGIPKIGKGRDRVRQTLLKCRDTKKLMSMEEFKALCHKNKDVSSPDALLSWLHADGTVFYRKELFNDQIVLDQQWALDAIYAVFDRKKGAVRTVQEAKGRFTRELLAPLVWSGYTEGEQNLFLSMMVSCGICFEHRTVREQGKEVPEYIAPDLLPHRDDMADDIDRHWPAEPTDPTQVEESAKLTFPVLHTGLIRTILSTIGEMPGSENALYWNRGIIGLDTISAARFMVEHTDEAAARRWQGIIHIHTRGPDANGLLSRLLSLIHGAIARVGLKGVVSPPVRERPRDEWDERLSLAPMVPTGRNWFVSYAWEQNELLIDCLCDAAGYRGITIMRDKDAMKLGDSISDFMNKLRDGERVFVVLSDKYLKSPFCMYELAEIWARCTKDPAQFLPRVCLWVLPDAKIWTPKDRAEYAIYWRKQHGELNAAVEKHGEKVLGQADRVTMRNMLRFSEDVGDILTTLADRVLPRTWAELVGQGFGEPKPCNVAHCPLSLSKPPRPKS